jgi:hypothetical protein
MVFDSLFDVEGTSRLRCCQMACFLFDSLRGHGRHFVVRVIARQRGGRQDFDVASEWLLLCLRGAEIMI